MRKRLKKFKKASEKVSGKVTDAAREKAVALNPLNPKVEEALSLENVPTITNENITEHREEVLKGARKFIYPLQHSARRIVAVTLTIVGAAIVGFLIYCVLALYHFYQYNAFLYRVTQVAPFPIAKVGGKYVDYENYLFELRHFVHYYETQQQQNFASSDQQLLRFRSQALNDVINNAYVKILAAKNHVSVSDKEVNARINIVRDQNRLGANDKVFSEVLHDYWGWSVADFRRSLKDQMLAEKTDAKLDTTTSARAKSALAQLKSGADFTTLAKQVSDDQADKGNGGDYGISIARDNPNIPPEVVEALFAMKPGQISDIIDAGSTLEIVKLTALSGDTVTAQHISFNLTPISTYISAEKTKEPTTKYVHFK